EAAVRDRALSGDVEDADVRVIGVIDVEQRFVRGEAQSVRLPEVVDEQGRVAAPRGGPRDALEVELLFALDAEAGHPPVCRVAEVDRAARVPDHVVRAVQLLALIVAGQYFAPAPGPVRVHPND